MITFPFPKEFLFGTASSSFQIEGSPYADGKTETVWDYMCRVLPESFHENAKTEPASSFYKNYEQDIADMKELGLKSFRLSIVPHHPCGGRKGQRKGRRVLQQRHQSPVGERC